MNLPIEYLITPFALVTNSVLLLAGIYSIKNRLSKVLPLCEGKHSVEGVITHSEYGMFASNLNLRSEALVVCSYRVNGKQYNEKVGRWGSSWGAIASANPKGKAVTVYYSPIAPEVSAIDFLPRKIDVITKNIFGHTALFLYLAFLAHSIHEKLSL